jgi:hypothetical protein
VENYIDAAVPLVVASLAILAPKIEAVFIVQLPLASTVSVPSRKTVSILPV